jgi:mRNA-degrading endonuclease RelE of RelBE toxin-antitoxin system
MALMSSRQPSVDIIAALEFQRRLRTLAKKYPQIRRDLEPVLAQLQVGNFVGDQIQGVKYTVFKERIRNSDIPTGKRGGYRLIYQLLSPTVVVLLLIYPKSDQADVPAKEIVRIIQTVNF